MRLLLISNSTNAGEVYLDYPKEEIRKFLGDKKITGLFFPYASVTMSFDDYAAKVRSRFNEIGHDIRSVHEFDDPVQAVNDAEAIIVGGGNTFHLLKMIRDNRLIGPVRQKVMNGIPYIGWSAGSNMACPTIRTTNDMPIVEPDGFDAFHLVDFQVNPHYLDHNPDGHAGETREDRIMEFLVANKDITVLGLREGCMLRIEDKIMKLIGNKPVRVFRYSETPAEMEPGEDFSKFL
ncbi:MAG: dipeptidase PepE [Bacteroidales bacterium]|nr:dipeptidase PepE [Bacteroidales bacterium]MDT8430379.1 dipeptidase PepE [Bacteroidales bacterium]